MTVYNIMKTYRANDIVYYQVLPYNLWGTLKWLSFKEAIKFLCSCSFSYKTARRKATILNSRIM